MNPLRNRVEYPDDLNDLIVQLAGEPGQDWVWKAGVVEDSQEPSDKAAGVFRDLPGLIDIIKVRVAWSLPLHTSMRVYLRARVSGVGACYPPEDLCGCFVFLLP